MTIGVHVNARETYRENDYKGTRQKKKKQWSLWRHLIYMVSIPIKQDYDKKSGWNLITKLNSYLLPCSRGDGKQVRVLE